MRAWRVREFGQSFHGLDLVDCPIPDLEPTTVLIRNRAAGVNFPDALVSEGTYQVRPVLPFTPGFEAIGEVAAAGTECKGVHEGERVFCWCGIGGFSEYVTLRPDRILRIPSKMTNLEAAAFLVSYQTAFFALIHRAGLRRGEVALIHAGAGALGSAAVQISKAIGATVIATTSSPQKARICKDLGADHVFVNTGEFAGAVRDVTAGKGADVVVDPVGGDVFEQSLKCIAWEGRILPVGFTSRQIPTISVNRVLLKNISVTGVYWSEYWTRSPARIHETHRRLTSLYEQGLLRPLVGKVFPFENLPDALAAVRSRDNYGKVVLNILA